MMGCAKQWFGSGVSVMIGQNDQVRKRMRAASLIRGGGRGRGTMTNYCGVFALFIALFPLVVKAHVPSDTFLSLRLTETNLSGRWEVALRDLQHALGLEQTAATALKA